MFSIYDFLNSIMLTKDTDRLLPMFTKIFKSIFKDQEELKD